MTAHNEKQLRKLLLALNHRLSPTVFLIGCDTGAQRGRLMDAIKEGSPQYKHVIVDLGPHAVFSLRDAIARIVPEEVKASRRLEYVVHFTGLSSSLWATNKDGKLEHTRLMDELNFERERLFHDYPFISFIWEPVKFIEDVFYKAGDFFVWLVDRYAFEVEGADEVVEEIPGKERLLHFGADSKRLAQITRLENLLSRLNESAPDQRKLLTERTETLLSLGYECTRAFEAEKAAKYFSLAGRLIEQHFRRTSLAAKYHFYLGAFFLRQKDYLVAMDHSRESLTILQELNEVHSLAAVYHQIGRIHAAQREWRKALNNYQHAIDWNTKSGNEFFLGTNYFWIALVYQRQQQYTKALEYYQKSLEWCLNTNNIFQASATHFQIGLVHESRGRWQEALQNFLLSLENGKASGMEESFFGVDYYQIGLMYEYLNNLPQAMRYYNIAKDNMLTHNNTDLPLVDDAITRTRKKSAR